MAIDEGGPTKHFSDQVWRQLPELKVKKVKVQKVEKEVPLFDKYGVSLHPTIVLNLEIPMFQLLW